MPTISRQSSARLPFTAILLSSLLDSMPWNCRLLPKLPCQCQHQRTPDTLARSTTRVRKQLEKTGDFASFLVPSFHTTSVATKLASINLGVREVFAEDLMRGKHLSTIAMKVMSRSSPHSPLEQSAILALSASMHLSSRLLQLFWSLLPHLHSAR